jgi:hypothetical protein
VLASILSQVWRPQNQGNQWCNSQSEPEGLRTQAGESRLLMPKAEMSPGLRVRSIHLYLEYERKNERMVTPRVSSWTTGKMSCLFTKGNTRMKQGGKAVRSSVLYMLVLWCPWVFKQKCWMRVRLSESGGTWERSRVGLWIWNLREENVSEGESVISSF